jgi:hypothetical protein
MKQSRGFGFDKYKDQRTSYNKPTTFRDKRFGPYINKQIIRNKSLEKDVIIEEGGLTYYETIRQEYGGNNCKFSAGFVKGANKPPEDTMYIRLEKDGVEPTTLLLTPDEMQVLAWISTGAIWSHLMATKRTMRNVTK